MAYMFVLFSGYNKRKIDNRDTTLCKFYHMTHVGETGGTLDRLKRDVIPEIIRCTKECFVSFDHPKLQIDAVYRSCQLDLR